MYRARRRQAHLAMEPRAMPMCGCQQGQGHTLPENHLMKPYLFRYEAMPIRAANQVRVSQAALLLKHSFHVTCQNRTPSTETMTAPALTAAIYHTLSEA